MSEWKYNKLTELMDVIGGGTPKTSNDSYWNGQIPWLSVVDFNNDERWVSSTEKTITQDGLENSSTKLLNKGDIIISARGTVGQIAQLSNQMAFNQSCYGLRAKEEIGNDFLYYLVKFSIKKLLRNTHGGVFDTITRETFSLIENSIPVEKEERDEIAKTLSNLDKKITLLRKQNQDLEELAQTLFKRWFVEFEFPNENGEPYKSSGGIMTESELGEIPEGWRVGSLGDEFTILMGQSPDGSSYNENQEGKVFYQGRTDFGFRFPTNRLYTTEPKRIADKFDVLVSVRAPVGDVNMANEECCIGRGLAAVKSDLKSYCFNKIKSLKKAFDVFENEGTVFGSLSKNDFNSLEVLVPDKKIAAKYNQVAMRLDLKIYENTNEIQTLTQLRDTLLPKLMSGELRVNI